MALPMNVVKAEALLQTFSISDGSCGFANVLTTVCWLISLIAHYSISQVIGNLLVKYLKESSVAPLLPH